MSLPTRKHFLLKGLLNGFKPNLLFTAFLILIAQDGIDILYYHLN